MSERVYTDTPPREDSDIERVKVTGRPKRRLFLSGSSDDDTRPGTNQSKS